MGHAVIVNTLKTELPRTLHDVTAVKHALETVGSIVKCYHDCTGQVFKPFLLRRELFHIYRPKRSFGQGNIFTSVCQEFCPRGRGYLTRHPPPDQAGTPLSPPPPGTRHPPPVPGQEPPRDQTPPQTRPPWNQTPPLQKQQTPEYGQRSAGTHPTGMHSCLGLHFFLWLIVNTSMLCYVICLVERTAKHILKKNWLIDGASHYCITVISAIQNDLRIISHHAWVQILHNPLIYINLLETIW